MQLNELSLLRDQNKRMEDANSSTDQAGAGDSTNMLQQLRMRKK